MQYSSKPELNKAYVRAFRNRYAVYKYTSVTKTGATGEKVNEFGTYEEAKSYAAELNDWQHLGDANEEVYKGHAVFNKAFKVQPWEHVYLSKDKIFFFVWDTRELTRVAARPGNLDTNIHLYIEHSDNHKPISKNGKWLQKSELLRQAITFKTDKQEHENFKIHARSSETSR